jgi:hypothetical protein
MFSWFVPPFDHRMNARLGPRLVAGSALVVEGRGPICWLRVGREWTQEGRRKVERA